jgi:L-aminopeptidase/D-esterase-like protein
MGKMSSIVDVPGIKVGQESNLEALTGCTVVICERGAVAGVDVRGGAPGSRETDLMKPENLVDRVHAIFLGGGSAFGLDGASGVMQYLEERKIGFDVGVTRVPIVPASVLFDLTVGDYRVRPDKEMGYRACLNATDQFVKQGNAGAGTGATVGKFLGPGNSMKSGLGTYSVKAGDLVVGAIVAVNAFGDVIDPVTGEILAGTLKPDSDEFADTVKLMSGLPEGIGNAFVSNTTIGVIATNAKLTKAGANKVASMAHNGLARTIRPCHTMFDGDTIYAMSTSDLEADINVVGLLACEVMAKAVVNAVIYAESIPGYRSYKDIKNMK